MTKQPLNQRTLFNQRTLLNRRTLLGGLVAAGSFVLAGVVGIPALLTGLSPGFRSRREQAWRSVGPLGEFPVGSVQVGRVARSAGVWPLTLQQREVFVSRRSEEELVVFSRSCTDLGCPLDYDPGSTCFFCPCHGGIFAHNGSRLAGPPNGPMYRYTHRVRAGVLEIDLSSIPPAA